MSVNYLFNQTNNLCDLAEQEFKLIGYEKMWPVDGNRFKTLVKVIGFKNALYLKALFIRQIY